MTETALYPVAEVQGLYQMSHINEWKQYQQPPERDNRPHELAARYHKECEAYDRTVCTGPIGQDGIMPANPREMRLINLHAHAVLKLLAEEAAQEGTERKELSRAIGRWWYDSSHNTA